MSDPLFRKVDCVLLAVPNLGDALRFYSDALGHPVAWRMPEAAGLAMPETNAELVLHTALDSQTDLMVASVDDALPRFVESGGTILSGPFDIPIGRCAVIRDPFGNTLVILDHTRGTFVTDTENRVIGTTADTPLR
ncbi:MAG TPA: VOC family protein [Stellaceae bacterium]|jgi:predicted enzyme related to lactoylglutathione lyase|nr:VOC family protein [Stellaceae bacterium]